MEEKMVYGVISGLGTGVNAMRNAVNQNGVTAAKIQRDTNGVVRAYWHDGRTLGRVMPANHSSVEIVRKKVQPNGDFVTAEFFSDILEKMDINGSINIDIFNIIPASTFVFKCNVNAIGQEVEVSVDTPDEKIDNSAQETKENTHIKDTLDMFSEENRPNAEARLDYLSKFTKVNVAVKLAFLKNLLHHERLSEFKIQYINIGDVDRVGDSVKTMLIGGNLALTGPKGTGKNTFIRHIAELFNLQYLDVSMHKQMSKDELFGSKTIKEDGTVAHELSEAMVAVQKPYLLNFDEVNMASPSVLALLHSLTDNRRKVLVPNYGIVEVNPLARFSFTMNQGESYAGTGDMNAAFVDRFHHIAFETNPDMMVEVVTKSVSDAGLTISKSDAKRFANFFNEVVGAVQASAEGKSNFGEELSEDVVSIRSFVEASIRYASGFDESIMESLEECYLKKLDVTCPEEAEIVRQLFYIKKA